MGQPDIRPTLARLALGLSAAVTLWQLLFPAPETAVNYPCAPGGIHQAPGFTCADLGRRIYINGANLSIWLYCPDASQPDTVDQ